MTCPECWLLCPSARELHTHYEEDHLPWALRTTRGPPSPTEAIVMAKAGALYEALKQEDIAEVRRDSRGHR